MATLQEIVDEVALQTTTVTSLVAFIDGLKAQIAAIPGMTAEMQAQVDSIFTAVDANTDALAAAMVVNVPPPVEPPVV